MGAEDHWLFLLKSSPQLCTYNFSIWQLTRELCMMEKDSYQRLIGRDSSGKPQQRDQPAYLDRLLQAGARSSGSLSWVWQDWEMLLCRVKARRSVPGEGHLASEPPVLSSASAPPDSRDATQGGGGTSRRWSEQIFFQFGGWEGRNYKWKDIKTKADGGEVWQLLVGWKK